MKYSPRGGRIDLTLDQQDQLLRFQVKDEGIGIPKADQVRLFEAFHRATNVATISGTGLGLAIAKRCVDLHQGKIQFESEVGAGSIFTVLLPLQKAIAPAPKSAPTN